MIFHGKKTIIFCAACCLLSFARIFADEDTAESDADFFYHDTLSNGLEIFTAENSAVPLAYIEIAVRTGGISQTPETAGLFHLYEHMMFKGNSKYRTAAAVQKALSDLGVSDWNGSTADEYVNYYFTVPSALLKQGMEFWSYAVRTPLLNETELENEKAVVLSEITGTAASPSNIRSSFILRNLFPDYPWKTDPAGNPENVKNATVEQLRDIQKNWYVPENTALFIGGDVSREQVVKLAEKIFGGWKRNSQNSAAADYPQQTMRPFQKAAYFVQTDPGISEQSFYVTAYYRGPDAGIVPQDTYPADIWTELINNPSSKFVQNMTADNRLSIPSENCLSCSYATKRYSGRIAFSAMLSGTEHAAERALLFWEKAAKTEIPAMILDHDYFPVQEYNSVKQRLLDDTLLSAETAANYLQTLRFWWASSSVSYYRTYIAQMEKTSPEDISQFLKNYIADAEPMIIVLLNPDVYEQQKQQFRSAGFTEITAENARWYSYQGNEK
ncbi:MAG: insulinase family protein [Bacteroides sp.]|nr:insulinase family protein [Prevotella sp.]MCM1408240.1 insulinase family protein [Treponema brennaborense]MCM1469564.1 insulinase family protein [Bacteroides sp.]